MIASSGELLLTIVNDVLDYSKLESGNVEIEVKESNLQDALSATVHSMNLKGAAKNVSVDTFYDPSVPKLINTDIRRLSQVLYNLIGNALKFSRVSQSVEFGVSICTADYDEGLERTANRYSPPRKYHEKPLPPLEDKVIRFRVKDYGRGINEKDFPKIFRPFLQADHETESLYGGTGLGLSITSKLVHGLGGAISVESVEGQWTRFTVDLPYEEAAVDTDTVSERLRNATVLLVGCDQKEQNRMVDIFRCLQVNCMCLKDCQDVKEKFSADGDVFHSMEKTPIFLLNEEAFDVQTYGLLSSQRRSILLTFGPSFKVKQARRHYRSLTEVLPSILLENMARYFEAPDDDARGSIRRMSTGDLPPSSYRDLRVLIAEDNLVNQKVLSRILTRLGLENLVVVDNGAKAVEREAAEPFDVVLM